MIGSPLERPDPERSWEWFTDEDGDVYEVGASPALMPIVMTQGRSATLLMEVVYLPLWSLVGSIGPDRRWKVVVASKPSKRATMFHAVHVEFCQSSDAADARRDEIVQQWRRGQFAGVTPMTSRELGCARRETRSGRPAPAARTLEGYNLTRMRARSCLAQGVVVSGVGLAVIALDLDAELLFLGGVAVAVGLVFLLLGAALWMRDRMSRAEERGA